MGRFKVAVLDQTEKVFTAFVTWGVGILLMTAYCIFVFWLNKYLGLYAMIIGAVLFLTAVYFLIDLWWNLTRAGLRD